MEIIGAATADQYSSTANELVSRIVALIPDHPEILTMESAWRLFDSGLECSDVGPTLYQASWALARAKQEWSEREEQCP